MNHIKALDGIRGIAALMVCFTHTIAGVWRYQILPEEYSFISNALNNFLLSGVDLFFVLSGFLIGGIIIDNSKGENFIKAFFIRRVCRIIPVYLILILPFFITVIFLEPPKFFEKFLLDDPIPLWPYAVFLQSYPLGILNTDGPNWVGITWSLSVEEQFYVIFPFLFLLIGKRKIFFTLLALFPISLLIRSVLTDQFGSYAGYMLFPARMDTIAGGFLLAYVMRSDFSSYIQKIPSYAWLVLSIIFLLSALIYKEMYQSQFLQIHFSMLTAGYMCLITMVFSRGLNFLKNILESRILVFFGSISYALYMYHQFVNGFLHGYFFDRKPVIASLEQLLIGLAVIGISIFLAWISLHLVELPVRKIGKRFKYS